MGTPAEAGPVNRHEIGKTSWKSWAARRLWGETPEVDTITTRLKAPHPRIRFVQKFGAIARADRGLLEDTPANRLVAVKRVSDIMEEYCVRHCVRCLYAPLVVESLFVATAADIRARDWARSAGVRERKRRYQSGRRTFLQWLIGHDSAPCVDEEDEDHWIEDDSGPGLQVGTGRGRDRGPTGESRNDQGVKIPLADRIPGSSE